MSQTDTNEVRQFVQERIDAGDIPDEIRRKAEERGYEFHVVEKHIRRKFSDVPREF